MVVRAIGLLAVALVLMAAMVALGLWQFGVYDDHRQDDALARMRRAPVALDQAIGPDQALSSDSVGVPVSVEGHYDASGQLYVEGLGGARDAYAVVTPLITSSGAGVLVVRGSTSRPQASTPAGPVQLAGILEPSQSGGRALDEARVTDAINIAGLVGRMNEDLYGGYVVSTTSDPADHLALVRPPLPTPSRWAGLRNLLYALQWWVFAGFVGFMWWRIVGDDRAAGRPAGSADPAQPVDAETVG